MDKMRIPRAQFWKWYVVILQTNCLHPKVLLLQISQQRYFWSQLRPKIFLITVANKIFLITVATKIFSITVATKIFGQFEFCWLTVAVSSKLAGPPCQGHLYNITSTSLEYHHHQNTILSRLYHNSIKILSQYQTIVIGIRVISVTSNQHQQNVIILSPDS